VRPIGIDDEDVAGRIIPPCERNPLSVGRPGGGNVAGTARCVSEAPNDPAAFETVAPGDVIPLGRGEELRVIAVETDIHQELVDEDFNGVTTVAPA
jgi:hypothetical protein